MGAHRCGSLVQHRRVFPLGLSERWFMSVSGSFGTFSNLFLSGDLCVSSLGGFRFVFFVVWVVVSLVVFVGTFWFYSVFRHKFRKNFTDGAWWECR